MLSDAELTQMLADAERMQALREKATPGPWQARYPRSDDFLNVRIFADSMYLGSITNSDEDTDTIKANADFIAATRTDPSAANVLRLVEEVRRLRFRLQGFVEHPSHYQGYYSRLWMEDLRTKESRQAAASVIIDACYIHGVPVPEHLKAYEKGGAP